MPRKLDVFDFDGTLFRSPVDTPENRRIFEDKTGIPWIVTKEMSRDLTRLHKQFVGIRKGWFGRQETLEPPLVPMPAPREMFINPVCEAFLKSKADPDSITLMMTGRHAGLKAQVLRIVQDGGLVEVDRKTNKEGKLFCNNIDANVTTLFLGDDGPRPKGTKPTETLPWKMWILEQYVKVHPEISTVEIWEDRKEHVNKFQELHGALAEQVIVNFIDGL